MVQMSLLAKQRQSQKQKTNVQLPSGGKGGVDWETGTDISVPLCSAEWLRGTLLLLRELGSKLCSGTSLVAQWLGICPAKHGMGV